MRIKLAVDQKAEGPLDGRLGILNNLNRLGQGLSCTEGALG